MGEIKSVVEAVVVDEESTVKALNKLIERFSNSDDAIALLNDFEVIFKHYNKMFELLREDLNCKFINNLDQEIHFYKKLEYKQKKVTRWISTKDNLKEISDSIKEARLFIDKFLSQLSPKNKALALKNAGEITPKIKEILNLIRFEMLVKDNEDLHELHHQVLLKSISDKKNDLVFYCMKKKRFIINKDNYKLKKGV